MIIRLPLHSTVLISFCDAYHDTCQMMFRLELPYIRDSSGHPTAYISVYCYFVQVVKSQALKYHSQARLGWTKVSD